MKSKSFHAMAALGAFSAVLLAGCASTSQTNLDERVSSTYERVRAVPLTEVPKKHKGPRYDKPREAQEYYVRQRVLPGQHIPNERYDEARLAMERMPQLHFGGEGLATMVAPGTPSAQATISPISPWTYLGPNNAGGRSRAIAIHPTSPDIMLAAGVAGGVFRSTDAGATWTALGDAMQNMAVVSLEFAPNNPNIVYAGTGEGYFNADAVRGNGVFKSTDAGLTWTKLTATNVTPNPASDAWIYVYNLRVDPNNANNVWAANRRGVFRTTDGGATWNQVLSKSYCLDIEFNWNANVAVVSCGTLNLQGEVFRSTDRGATFSATPVLAAPNQSRTELAVSKSNPAVMYAAAAFYEANGTQNYRFRGLWHSSNSGATWTLRASHTDTNPFNLALLGDFDSACDDDPRAQGWYDLEVAVDPADPNRVWVGGIDIYRSDDGGFNFGRAGVWYEDGDRTFGIHADQHRIVFHPGYNGTTNQTMFVGNDGGIYRTNNARAAVSTWPASNCTSVTNPAVSWTELNDGFGVTQFYHGVVHPDGTNGPLLFLGGTQDNGTWFGENNDPDGWIEIFGGDGGYAAVDSNEGWNRFYTSYQNGNFIRWVFNPATNRYTTSNGTTGISDDGLAFITPFAMDPNNPQILWTGGSRMWRTNNGMQSWVAASTSGAVGGTGEVSAVAIAPGNSNLVLAGTDDGKVLRNTAALGAGSATTWENQQVTPNGVISEITFDPNTPGRVYFTQSRFGQPHVYRSDNNGASWVPIDGFGQAGGIPDIPAHSIAVDPDDSNRLYVGTDLGMFATIDGGANWAVATSPLPNTVVEKLVFLKDNGVRKLTAFTHGRGAWIANAGTLAGNERFNDVPISYWAFNQIEQIAIAGITNGCSAVPPLYCPTQSVTRAEMAVFLLRTEYGPGFAPPPASGIFADVPTDAWYRAWVEKLYADGITTGCETNPLRYCPDQSVTRAQMAVFLLRAKYGPSYTPPAATGVFADVPAGDFYAPWIEQLHRDGITTGCETNPLRYCPTNPVKRDEMAVFLVRAFNP